ncbi:MAG: FAD-binding oxidoreductase [Longimicrobiaceae bacterium]
MKQTRQSPPERFRGAWLTAADAREPYASAAGILHLLPRAVAIPEDADDVALLARWASLRGERLVPRAAGTGMPGGNVGGDVVVDLRSRFGGIGEVDSERCTVRVEPGVTRAQLNAACASRGLYLPVDPSSGDRATLGGMIANNSAGAHSLLHGAMRGWVEALQVVLATGELARLERGKPPPPALRTVADGIDRALDDRADWIVARWPRVRKNSSGYALREYLDSGDLLDLVIGSEGTLALVVSADVRLAPPPGAAGVALLEFTSLEAAGEAVERLLPLAPAACELLDRTFLDLVRESSPVSLREGLEAVLLIEFEAADEKGVQRSLSALRQELAAAADRVITASDPEANTRLWELRHAASPLIAARTDGRVSMQFIEDGVVPVARLADYVRLLRSTLARHRLPAVIFGHAGDGNLHVNPLVDVREPGWWDTVEAVLLEIADGVAALGGTLSGEHGDGRLRAPLLERIWGEEMVGLFRIVKEAFDPDGILNPGVILPLAGQRPLDGLRSYAVAP